MIDLASAGRNFSEKYYAAHFSILKVRQIGKVESGQNLVLFAQPVRFVKVWRNPCRMSPKLVWQPAMDHFKLIAIHQVPTRSCRLIENAHRKVYNYVEL